MTYDRALSLYLLFELCSFDLGRNLYIAYYEEWKNWKSIHLKQWVSSQTWRSRQKTYPADCRKIAAVDSNKHDWDWKNRRYWKKKRFLYKNILSPIYFDGIS